MTTQQEAKAPTDAEWMAGYEQYQHEQALALLASLPKRTRRAPRKECRRCGNTDYSATATGPSKSGFCGPKYCHYALSN